MSWLSVTLRKSAFGSGIADAFLGLEKSVATAVTNAPAVQGLQHQAIDDVGDKIKQIAVDKIVGAFPEAETVAPEVFTPLFAFLEASIEHFLQHAEATPVEGV